MRLKIVAGNWKMNNTKIEAEALISATLAQAIPSTEKQLNLFVVPYPYLMMAGALTEKFSNYGIAAQNCSSFEAGAYTGEVSAAMLASMGVSHCLVGHSERRSIFNEHSTTLLNKINLLLANQLIPIWCCGELQSHRENRQHFQIVKKQLEDEVFQLHDHDFSKVVIAYEPVWAIGTGLTASPEQAQEMHAFIRNEISKKYNERVADQTTILYGGSCNAGNAKELFSLLDVDGGLIGGASLKAESFVKLISIMYELH
jgi:triosephosphate isomerase